MMAFSASDAAFEGFRLARQRPLSVLVWAVFVAVFSILTAVLTVSMGGEAMNELVGLSQTTGEPDMAVLMALMTQLGPLYLLLLFVSLIFFALLFAAVERAAMATREDRFGHLRFGMVEIKHAVIFLLLGLMMFVIQILVSIVFGILAATLGAPTVLFSYLAMLMGLLVSIWFLAQFSMAGPVQIASGGLGLRTSWKLAKGRRWSLFGGLVLAAAMAVVVFLLILVIFSGVAMLAFGMEATGSVFAPDFSSLSAYFTPVMILYTVVVSLAYALNMAILAGFGARAYVEISGVDPVTVEPTPSL